MQLWVDFSCKFHQSTYKVYLTKCSDIVPLNWSQFEFIYDIARSLNLFGKVVWLAYAYVYVYIGCTRKKNQFDEAKYLRPTTKSHRSQFILNGFDMWTCELARAAQIHIHNIRNRIKTSFFSWHYLATHQKIEILVVFTHTVWLRHTARQLWDVDDRSQLIPFFTILWGVMFELNHL